MTTDELKKEAEEKFKEWKSEQYKDQSTEEKMEFVEHLHTFPKYFEKAFNGGYLASAEPREKRIAELEKENAELKEELKKWKDEWQEQVQKATDEGYTRTLKTMQLTKAKELLERFIVLDVLEHYDIVEEAEQFLSEVEK